MRVVVDTNIIIDFLSMREPYYEHARLLMIGGKLGEFELWVSSSQITDIVYITSNGTRSQELPSVLTQLRAMRTFLKVFPVGPTEIDGMLASNWRDPEDRLIYEVAAACNADAIITRATSGFQSDAIKVCTCEGFFQWLREEHGLDYADVDI